MADYGSVGITLGRHPLALLRGRLAELRMKTAADLSTVANGSHVRAAGIVTRRQRPGTASGVIFVTLDDEVGNINVDVWNYLLEKQRRDLLWSTLLADRLEKVIGVLAMLEREHPKH